MKGNFVKTVWEPVDRGDYYDIPLTQGYYAKIDKEDYNKIKDKKWSVCIDGKKKQLIYASCRVGSHINKSRTTKKMHRIIANASCIDIVDHINHDTLDNRKCNLRICTNKQNCENRKLDIRNKTGYTGVLEYKGNKYLAQIGHNNKNIHIGIFDTKEEASDAYNYYKKILHTSIE